MITHGVRVVRTARSIAVLLAVAAASANAQLSRRVTGRVVAADDRAPIPSAAVVATGTSIGTSTSDSGTFSLNVPGLVSSLTVRRIGFRQATVTLPPDETDVTVSLAKDVLRLETQIVTGVATSVSSRNAANAVTVLDSSAINEVPVPTIENALQGKIPGAVISQNNGGAPGGGMQVQIRGVTSLQLNSAPLYVIDGVIANNETTGNGIDAVSLAPNVGINRDGQENTPNRIADINPNDIESVEVLKGSSASSIYGARAAAGVIIITTKKGAPGKPKWDVTQRLGTSQAANTLPLRTFPTLASAQSWYAHDVKGGATGAALAADNAFIASIYAGPQDYQSQIFSAGGFGYETDVSVRGATENNFANYYLSGLTKYDPGIMTATGYNKQSVRTNVTANFSQAVSATVNLAYTHSLTRRGITGNDNAGGLPPYATFSYTPQFVNLNHENADGTWTTNPFGAVNPFQDAQQILTPSAVNRFIGGGTLQWTPLTTATQSLKFTFIGGGDYTNEQDQIYAPPQLQVEQAQPFPGAAVANNAALSYITSSANVIHHYTGFSWVDATTALGLELDKRSLHNPFTIGLGLPPGLNSASAGEVQTNVDSNAVSRDLSVYGQEQVLLFNQRLALTAGVTAERSTDNGKINKFFTYPKYSASYRIPGFAFFDEVKLRGAYGQSGTLPTYGIKFTSLVQQLNSGITGVYLSTIRGNPSAAPEVNTELETGFDATMLHSRASFSATVYQKRITDVALLANVSPSLGYNRQWFNGGEFTNQGIELQLGLTPIQSHSAAWTFTTSFYRNYNVVNNLPTALGPNAVFAPGGIQFGGPFGTFQIQPGRSVTQMVNTAIVLPNGLAKQVGDGSPTFVSEFTNEFTFHRFRLYGLLDWHYGGTAADLTLNYYDNGEFLYGDSASSATRITQIGNMLAPYVLPAGFVKLREVTLSYDLPTHFVDRIGFGRLSSLRLSLSGYNLWMSFKYNGLDPEVSNSGAQNFVRGQDVTPYPPARSYYVSFDLGL